MVQNDFSSRVLNVNDEESDLNIGHAYSRSRMIINDYSNDYDQMVHASKVADQRALNLFDTAINDVSSPRLTTPHKRRQRLTYSTERQLNDVIRPGFQRSSSEQPTELYSHKIHQPIKPNIRKRYEIISDYSPADSVTSQMRRIERRLDDMLDYKLPDSQYFSDLKKNLSSITSRMATHRNMIDKYSGVDMGITVPLSERIDAKSKVIQNRR